MQHCIYLDTRREITQDEYKEYCDANETPFDGTDEQSFQNYVTDVRQWEIDDFWQNLKYSKYKDNKVIIFGRLGLWDGKREIEPVGNITLEKAIHKCTLSAEDCEITQEVDGIHISSYHHDGVNTFVIKFLNQKGVETYEQNSKAIDIDSEEYLANDDVDFLY